MATRMQQRRGTAAQWVSTNNGDGPILEAGEIGFETDTGKFKIGDGQNHWVDLDYFLDESDITGITGDYVLANTLGQANGVATLDGSGKLTSSQVPNTLATTSYVDTAVSNLANSAPALLDTLNELAEAINDDPTFFTTVANNLANHESDTTNIHGITNTAELATKEFAANLLVNASKTNITITGNKDGLTITAENGVADSNTDNLVEGSTNLYFTNERAQDAVGNVVGTGLSYDDNTGAISTSNIPNSSLANSAVTINGFAISLGGSATYSSDNIGEGTENLYFTNARSRATVSGGTGLDYNPSTGVFDIDSTVTTNTGNQTLTNKSIDLANNTVTGTVAQFNSALSDANFITTTDTGTVTSAMIADEAIVNADISNTAAIAQSKIDGLTTDLAAKAALSGATFTGNVVVQQNLQVDGNFTVNGSNVLVSATQIQIEDSILQLAHDNAANTVDLGLVAGYNDGSAKHAGLVKDVSDSGKWKLFKGVTTEPSTTVDFTQATLDDLVVGGLEATSLTLGNVTNTEFSYLDGVTSGIQSQIDGKISASSTDTLLNKTVNLANNTVIGTVAEFNSALSDANFVTTADTGTVTSTMIADGTIVNADINASAAIALSKLATDPLARANHTGTQTSSTISDFNEAAQDAVGEILGSGLTYTDASNTITVDSTVVQLRVTGVSDTEIGYLDGVTSNVQAQLDAKAPINNASFTGTFSAPSGTITSTMLADETIVNADIANTAAIAQSKIANLTTDLAAKASLSGATFTGAISGTDLTLSGNLTVNGTTTNINSTNLVVEDKNVVLGDTATPTDASADGGGITLKGTTDKTLNWVDATDSWTSSENINLATGKTVKIAGTDVLTATAVLGKTLPSGTVVGTSDTQTLTGKTISGANNTLTVRLANDVTGTLPVANGGTGITALGTGVATFLGTPSSANLASAVTDETGSGALVFGTSPTLSLPSINNILYGYSTTVTAAGTTTLTSSSNYLQFFTGTTTQTIVLPVASTMTLGQGFYIENLSTGNLTVNSSGGNLVATVIPGGTILFTCILTSGTTAASWDADWHGFSTITGTGANVLGTAPTISNLVLTGTLNAGGGNGTNGQVLQSTGTGVQWGTAAASTLHTVFAMV